MCFQLVGGQVGYAKSQASAVLCIIESWNDLCWNGPYRLSSFHPPALGRGTFH